MWQLPASKEKLHMSMKHPERHHGRAAGKRRKLAAALKVAKKQRRLELRSKREAAKAK
jgi:hypothetical protein